MDVSVSVSFFQNELASIIEDTLKAAADTVLWEITKVVGSKFTEFRMEMAGKEKENESLKLRLEISESELKAVRECMNAADADIKQPLRNMNPDCNEQDFQRNENQGLFTRVKDSGDRPAFSEAEEGPVMEAVYTQEEICDQEWCGRIMEITDLTIVESKEIPELEPVHIKEEAVELECDHITEEVSKENKVSILENIVKMESSRCDDNPPELVCMKPNQPVSEDTGSSVGEEGTVLGSIQRKHHPPQERAADGKEEGAMPSTSSTAYEGEHDSIPSPRCTNSSSGKLQCKKRRETAPQEENVNRSRAQIPSVQDRQPLTLESAETAHFYQLGSPKTLNGSRTGRTPFPCADCGRRFNCLSQLIIHQCIHIEEKPHHCAQCGKRFSRLSHLKRHQRSHTGEKPHHCNDCGKRFTEFGCLKRHERIHTGEKPYRCNACGKSFTESGNLRKHQRIHLRETVL
ncbi:zinc finger protein 180-like isoform X2 [Acipenser ruthenus]|uniref:zinc finger protein 180-like isoform X2 n=1 Tax=Acipenser ruthenus TaxID=7906 RepID=UPI0027404AA4|nr:zinc finger protein 180-like isoform X2 [Acipenser ruthenus]